MNSNNQTTPIQSQINFLRVTKNTTLRPRTLTDTESPNQIQNSIDQFHQPYQSNSINRPEIVVIINNYLYAKNIRKGLCAKYQKLIKTYKMTKTSQCCAICCQQFQKDQLIKKLPCKHIFHRNCLKPWLNVNEKCPNCRFDIHQHFRSTENSSQTEEDK